MGGNVCAVFEKDMLEQLTWMLASAGQVAFLVVWGLSRSRSTQLDEITFDASMDEDRTRLRGMSDMIYLKQRPTAELLEDDNWNTAIERFEASTQGQEAMLVGLDMIRSTQAKMLLHVGLGRWTKPKRWRWTFWLSRADGTRRLPDSCSVLPVWLNETIRKPFLGWPS